MKKLYSTSLALSLMIMSGITHATCSFKNGAHEASTTINVSSLVTNTFEPGDSTTKILGTVDLPMSSMASLLGVGTSTIILGCTNSENIFVGDSNYSINNNLIPGTGIPYQTLTSIETGIPNLVLGLYHSNGTMTGIVFPFNGGNYTRTVNSINSGAPRIGDLGNGHVVLYKAGRISQGGIVPGGQLFRFRTSDGLTVFTANLASFTVNVKSCQSTTSLTNVSMGDVHKSRFKGVGSTAGDTGFYLELNCDSAIKPTLTFESSNASSGNIIPLSTINDSVAATGVGVQMLYGQNLVSLGTPVSLGSTTLGVNRYNFTARYIQTANPVTAGVANATVTYTIQYE